MENRPLIFDCDPGQDDAISLIMALSPDSGLDIRAITTVAGNTSLAKCQRNARMIAEICGRRDVPVFAGCEAPLKLPLATAEEVHGVEGLDGLEIFESDIPLQEENAVDAIIRLCRTIEGVVLVPTGPLTNIATALTRAPDIIARISEIVIMGGARSEAGNITPSAEFNIYVDPHAAKIVFDASVKKTVFGLDVTHKALIKDKHVDRIAAMGTEMGKRLTGMLRSDYAEYDRAKFGTAGTPIHDACTTAYLLQPDIFNFKSVNVQVETESELTRGHTAVDFWQMTGRPRDTNWAVGVDADEFFELMIDRIAAYPD
ncbi:MAG: nucleoside hydrolase [Litorimonas sp.]